MNAVQHEEITAGSMDATALTMTDAGPVSNEVVHYIRVTSGTIKFGKGSVHATAVGYVPGDTVPPTECRPGQLYFKASNGADKFTVTTVKSRV
jgi:hypothetical protein